MSELAVFDSSPAPTATPVVITLFGNLRILINGKAVDTFRLNKSRALLAYLLIEGVQPGIAQWVARFAGAPPERRSGFAVGLAAADARRGGVVSPLRRLSGRLYRRGVASHRRDDAGRFTGAAA